MNDIVKVEPKEVAAQPVSPNQLIAMAVESGADVDKLEKLMELQERWDAKEAKKAFVEAMSRFQSTVPTLKKTKEGHNYSYAPLGDIAEQIRQPLKECGLSYRFEMDHSSGVAVTCVVTHIDGHSEKSFMNAAPDTSGSKNAIQAIGSTVTYLQRYTLIGALGLTTADQDIDGRLDNIACDFITTEQELNIETLISDSSADRDKFLTYVRAESVEKITSPNYAKAITMLERKIKNQGNQK